MKLKKILATTAACALLVGTLAIPASAHGGGHHGRRASGPTTYPVCTVADCTLSYSHAHDGVTYCGHNSADGHTWCANGTGNGNGCGRCH